MSLNRSIATAQTVPVRGDVEANLQQHLRLAELAAMERAQLLVYPELSLTGYELDLAQELAFSRDDSRLVPLVEAASSLGMIFVVGAPVRIDSRLCLGAFIISPDRTIEIYTKHHLGAFPPTASAFGVVPPAEATVFAAGCRNPLIRFDDNTAAVAVCADTGRASHAEAASSRGAQIYLASMFVIPSDFEHDMTNLQTYATRHSMAVAFANYGGPSGGLLSAGRSAIWSETGELLTQLAADGAGVAVATQTRAGWTAMPIMLDTV